jgi:hypothetical protein
MRIAWVVLAFLAATPAAHAACPVSVSRDEGPAPLRVVLRAGCESASYRWRLGDGTTAKGRVVRHSFAAGRFVPRLVTDRGSQRLRPLTSIGLTLVAPRRARYGEEVTLRARVVPRGLPVRIAGERFRGGRLTVTVTRPHWTAVAGRAAARATILVEPRLELELEGAPVVGSRLRAVAVLRPRHAGTVRVEIDGKGTSIVDTRLARTARIVARSKPRPGWAPAWRALGTQIRSPALGPGARGPAVVALEQRLLELGYALRDANGLFEQDDLEAVLAFQKLLGEERTGRMTPALWRRLERASRPRARYAGNHVEVDKARQLLFLVRGGRVVLTTHVSTGATGNTPPGAWRVYRKLPGWDWVLWYPSYFLRGFAIHGYPEVPAYPASHGCVRVPMWLAARLYAEMPAGSTVIVY